MSKNRSHRQGPFYRQDDGTYRDERDRQPGPDAVEALIASIPPGPDWNQGRPANLWTAAETAVEAADEGTVRAALARLLALHMFDLEDTRPQVATRNIKVNDLIQISGIPSRVTEKIDDGRFRARMEHRPNDTGELFGGGQSWVHYPLLERPAPTSGSPQVSALCSIAMYAVEKALGSEIEEDADQAIELDGERVVAERVLFTALVDRARLSAPAESHSKHYLTATGERDRLLAAARRAFLAGADARRDFLAGGAA